jgi:osmotically-inducible protein OsmY
MEWDPSLDNRGILVAVKDGVVTLGGHVPAYADKWGAEKATKNVAGVRAVANEIDVKPATPHSDQEIAAAALNALKANVSVPASDIKVLVSDGWITLEGKVKFWHQRNAAEEAVRSLWGVRASTTPSKSIRRSTPETSGARSTAFKRHADLDADKVTVTVRDDTVTLTGEVPLARARGRGECRGCAGRQAREERPPCRLMRV